MRGLRNLYYRSSWYEVFNFSSEAARARSYLLLQVMISAIVGGFTGGVFYTGYLVGHGINIVNISILTVIPYATCLFSLLTPYILERFPKRRWVLSIARLSYFTIQILGVSLLPLVVHSENGRIIGLVIIVFVANTINFLFSGYSPWHMPYITPDVRMNYFAATTLVSSVTSTVFLVITSIVTDRLNADHQLTLISILRYVAYGLVFLDVYFLQKPREPEYLTTADKPKLLDIFRLPISNKPFRLSMLIVFFYQFGLNLSASVLNTWLLKTVGTGYLYINVINALWPLFIMLTSRIWNRVMQKMGTFSALAFIAVILSPTYFVYAFVNSTNFFWLMTAVRLVQHGVSMLQTYSAGNIIYISLPEKDQTNYISFHTVVANAGIFCSMMVGTGVVAIMGERTFHLFGISFDCVQVLLLATGVMYLFLAGLITILKRKLPQEGAKKELPPAAETAET